MRTPRRAASSVHLRSPVIANVIGIIIIVVVALGVGGCTTAADEGKVAAERACGVGEVPTAVDRSERIDDLTRSELIVNAERSRTRADDAALAAALDDRWGALADALAQIAAVADRLATAGSSSPTDTMTAQDWVAYKAASNAAVLECRDVMTR